VTVEFLNASDTERLDVWFHEWPGRVPRHWVTSINSFTGKIPFVTARAFCATNFDVQLTGSAPVVALRFTIHSAPLFIVSPQSRTVSSGDSVFFGVVATAHSNLQYQWLHNGEMIPGETFPILSLDHVVTTNAGAYQVMVSDDLGTNSAEVTLTVSETNVPPRWVTLRAVSTNEWRALLVNEAGRSYRIEGSTNLTNWLPVQQVFQETSIKYGTSGAVRTGGIVFLRETNSEIRFTTTTPNGFFRAVRYDPPSPECINTLKRIRFAKEILAYSFPYRTEYEPSIGASDAFADYDVAPLMRSYKPPCPIYGPNAYSLGNYGSYGSQPFCMLHTLLEPDW
jgi:hypothetical protein